MQKYPWSEMEAAYVAGEMTTEQLAKQYGAHPSTVRKYALKGKWCDKRRENRAKKAAAAADAITRAAISTAKQDLAALIGTAGKIAKKADELASAVDANTSPRDLKAIADTLASLIAVYRVAGGVRTPEEQTRREIGLAQVEIHRQRLALEQKRLGAGQDGAAEIIIAGEAVEYAD